MFFQKLSTDKKIFSGVVSQIGSGDCNAYFGLRGLGSWWQPRPRSRISFRLLHFPDNYHNSWRSDFLIQSTKLNREPEEAPIPVKLFRSLIISGAIYLLFILHTSTQAQNPTSSDNSDTLVIVAFGNSITATRKTIDQVFAQRLPALLAEKSIPVRVINAGVPGSHTGSISDNNLHNVQHALDRFASDVLAQQPDLVTIGFGTNDAHIDSKQPNGTSRIPLSAYQKNLTYFIQELQRRDIQIVLITPNPLAAPYENFQNDRLIQYVKVVRKLAKKFKTGLVDNYKMFSEYPAKTGKAIDTLLLDGVHPNDEGHRLIAENLANEIAKVITQSEKKK